MIRTMLIGANGRMRQKIVELISRSELIRTIHITDENITIHPQSTDVILCFADNGTILAHLRIAAEQNIPIIAGSKGFDENEMGQIRTLAGKTRCVLIPNVGLHDTIVNDAIRATQWVVQQANGLYDMQDVVLRESA